MTTRILRNRVALVALGLGILVGITVVGSKGIGAFSIAGSSVAGTPPGATAQNSGTSSGSWNYQRIGIVVPGKQLRILLVGLSTATDYIVGVRSDTQAAGLVAGEVTFSNLDPTSFRTVSQIVDWPRERIEVLPGVIRVSGLSKATGSVLLYVTVPSGTEVTVDSANETLVRSTPANSLIVHNGVSIAQEVEGIRTLVSTLRKPNHTPNTTRIVKRQDGQYFATPKGLASNLVSLKKPAYPAVASADEIEQVLLRITIDEAGVVKQVDPVTGKKPFLDAAAQAVSEWKFLPFSADDKHVAIKASVVFFFGRDGAVTSPIFDELRK